MGEKKTLVRVRLNAEQLALVDEWRDGIKARSGLRALPARSTAIAGLVSAFGDFYRAAKAAGKAETSAPPNTRSGE